VIDQSRAHQVHALIVIESVQGNQDIPEGDANQHNNQDGQHVGRDSMSPRHFPSAFRCHVEISGRCRPVDCTDLTGLMTLSPKPAPYPHGLPAGRWRRRAWTDSMVVSDQYISRHSYIPLVTHDFSRTGIAQNVVWESHSTPIEVK